MRVGRCRCLATGAGLGSFLKRSNAGCIGTTGCTTASATSGKPEAAGGSNAWRPDAMSPGGDTGAHSIRPFPSGGGQGRGLLVAVGDDRGVEVVAGVVAAGGHQTGAGLDVAQGSGLAVLFAGGRGVIGGG